MTRKEARTARPFWQIAVVGVALAAAIASVRDWSARAPQSHALSAISRLWVAHPEIAAERLAIDAAKASQSGRLLDEDATARMFSIARRAPLEAQPFLVAGALAQLKGDGAQARQLYLAARLRSPRGIAARLLLADLELRSGQVEEGLSNLVAIARLSGGAVAPIAPALAEFARTPGSVLRLKTALSNNPVLAASVMEQLATDPSNAPLLFALESARTTDGLPPWQQKLIDTTAAAGDVPSARRYWARFNRVESHSIGTIYNERFQARPGSPPFNWSLMSGASGIAELRPEGGLSIVHFGREPTIFARQLLSLEAGVYQLKTRFAGPLEPGRLEWRLQCVRGGPSFVIAAVGEGAEFRIDRTCPAAWLQLHAMPSDSGSRLDAVLLRVALRKVG